MRQKDAGVGNLVQLLDFGHRIARDIRRRDLVIDNLVHERRVGPVFQKAPYEISQKVAVGTDRGVDAAPRIFRLFHDAMQGLPHAMQALELETVLIVAGHRDNSGTGMRVMRG